MGSTSAIFDEDQRQDFPHVVYFRFGVSVHRQHATNQALITGAWFGVSVPQTAFWLQRVFDRGTRIT